MDDVPLLSQTTYEQLSAGDRWGPFTEDLDAETLDALPAGGVLPLLTLRILRRALDGVPPGGVLVRQSFAVKRELVPGPVDVDVFVSARQQPPSGLYTTFTFGLSQDGAAAALVDWMILAP